MHAKNKYPIFIFLGTLASFTSGCKKDEAANNTSTQTDARDIAVGSYRGTYYYTHNNQTQTEARTVLITKGANNNQPQKISIIS